MAARAIAIMNIALQAATDIWSEIVEATGLWSSYLGAIIMLLLLRYLLAPIFGGRVRFGAGRSDTARPSRKDTDDG